MDQTRKVDEKELRKAFIEWARLEKKIPMELARIDGLKARRSDLATIINIALAGSMETLTNREKEVLAMVRDGKSNKFIAIQMGVTERTAKFHVSALLRKFDRTNRHEL